MARTLALGTIVDLIQDQNDAALTADGFDDAIIGYVEAANAPTRVLYDREKCIQVLIKRDKMTREMAEEYFNYNVIGAYVGENGPAFATVLRK